MNENPQARRPRRTRLWLALSALCLILALLVVPPFISIRRYRSRITQVISASVGRPVRLSSVELRILPRPAFVITDLVVEDDPAYGYEPLLHANTVTASIRLLPLWWRARLEIGRISVDEASLNLVRTQPGRWNLDSFFRTAARAQGSTGGKAVPLPYLEATDSRVNIKNGVEKLPYSLLNADLAFWQENPGDWRVRLKGQPARTDVNLDLGDTGIVRLEGSLRKAPALSQMPIHLDVNWREAQLGQLSRLTLGDDEGWRGNLTGELHMDGTAAAAQVHTRLRASGVHRAEFAPVLPMDFDASCNFVYHYSERGLEKVACDSPVGDGQARLTGDVAGPRSSPSLTLELDRVPVQVGLDLLRTVRSGLDPSLQAAGAMSGKISYKAPGAGAPVLAGKSSARTPKAHASQPAPLSGSVTVAGLRLSGDALSRPILIPKVVVEPAPGQAPALTATVAVPLGASAPLNFTARLAPEGYQVAIRGAAALPRLRDLARICAVSQVSLLDNLDGPPASLDLRAGGPWLHPAASPPIPEHPTGSAVLVSAATDHVNGTMTLRGATWKADFLAGPADIANATLRFDESGAAWDPVAFSFGPMRGTATFKLQAVCQAEEKCKPHFTVDFDSLDAAEVQAVLLGAHEPGTLFSGLLARLRPGSPSSPSPWPDMEGTAHAGSLTLGPVTLTDVAANLEVKSGSANIPSFDAGLLGGRIHAQGSIVPGEKPGYQLEGRFEQVNAANLGQLLGMAWTGNALDGEGKVELAGFTDKDLAASAKGSLHFDWRHGAIADKGDVDVPQQLVRFDRWTAEAEIANGAITLKENQIQRGPRKLAVTGSAIFGDPPRVTFGEREETRVAVGKQAKP